MEFDKVARQSPIRLKLPDGGKSLINAARKLTIARKEMLMAQTRLHNCQEQEDVPEDLTRSAIA